MKAPMKGKVDTPNGIVDKDNASNVPRALLADFGVDSAILQPDHVVWLDGLATFLRPRQQDRLRLPQSAPVGTALQRRSQTFGQQAHGRVGRIRADLSR
jgi:hypothetical protein